MSQDPQEGQDSLDNEAFLGNQGDKEDQVMSSERKKSYIVEIILEMDK